MIAAETLALTRFVRAACPQQKFDEYTPDAWHELLSDLPFADCNTAVRTLAKRQPFISPGEIRAEVAHIRADRIRANFTEPAYDINDVNGGLAAIRAHRRAIADGQSPAEPEVLPDHREDVEKEINKTLQRLPRMPRISS